MVSALTIGGGARTHHMPDEPVLLSGRVIGTAGGRARELWRKRPRDGRFHQAFVTPTGAGGHYGVLVSGPDVNTNVAVVRRRPTALPARPRPNGCSAPLTLKSIHHRGRARATRSGWADT